jgi:hypothetical protein
MKDAYRTVVREGAPQEAGDMDRIRRSANKSGQRTGASLANEGRLSFW